MVDIISVKTAKKETADKLKLFFESRKDLNGVLYFGHPILPISNELKPIDALWLSPEYGIVAFDIIQNKSELIGYDKRQELMLSALDSKLRQYPECRRGKKEFLINIEVVSFSDNIKSEFKNDEYVLITSVNELEEYINSLERWEHPYLFGIVLSILQSAIVLKKDPPKTDLKKENSKAAKLHNLESNIAVLDKYQEKAVLEFYDGVQRIRGLAGSGKTIVLALKAATIHAEHPDWDIAVTFYTRSLKQVFYDLIRKFFKNKTGKNPNFEKLKIIHCWGSKYNPGLYYEFCTAHKIKYYTFREAKSKISSNYMERVSYLSYMSFDFACKEALAELEKKGESANPQYDVILVDEAQDISPNFLKLCYKFLRGNKKKLIYAYDELQRLNEGSSLPNPKEFLIPETEDFDDRILKVCYRNPRPNLVTAHALGFGIYRVNDSGSKELVQFFDDPNLWDDVGYIVEQGKMEPGNNVILKRTNETSPDFLEKHSDIDDLILFKAFPTAQEQAKWVCHEIYKNIKEDELNPENIMIIHPIIYNFDNDISLLIKELKEKEINFFIPGKDERSKDRSFQEGAITITNIFRAKGNEVPMVYLIHSEYLYSGIYGRNLITKRNILFTAITRSKSWIRVCGVGSDMEKLIEEFNQVKNNDFKLNFIYPTPEEIKRLNLIHRDIDKRKIRTKDETRSLEQTLLIINEIKEGRRKIDEFPEEYRELLKKLIEQK